MNNEFNELQRKWKNDKKDIGIKVSGADEILSKINIKKRESLYFHYGTIITLLITLIGISLFSYYIAPVEKLLSRIGVGLMISGLAIRIVIEIISIIKSIKYDVLDDVLKVTDNTISFYNFRKIINGTIAPIIAGVYTVGFYMISPEFSLYFSTWKMILIDVSYVIIAVFLFIHIRKGITKEMKALSDIIQLRKEIIE